MKPFWLTNPNFGDEHSQRRWFDQVQFFTKALTQSVSKTADYTVRTDEYFVRADATAGNVTITLPSAEVYGKPVGVMKTDSSGNTVTIDGHGSETINGSATQVLSSQNDLIVMRSNGTNWDIEFLTAGSFSLASWTDLTDGGATTLHKHDHGNMDGLSDNDHPQYLLVADIDDVAVNGEVAQPISSNWAFDHVAASDPHTGYRLESADHSHQSTGLEGGQLDHGLALTGLSDNDHPQYLLVADIDDTPVNGETAQPISSNWAFDHVAAADPHTGYRLESADHNHQSTGAQAGQLDHGLALTGLTDDDHTQYLLASAATDRATFATNWTDLTDAGDTTLHQHSAVTVADEASDTTCFLLFATGATGNVQPKTNSNLAINASNGAITFSSVGPHGVGTSPDARYQFALGGTFSHASGASTAQFRVAGALNPLANADAYTQLIAGTTINEASSGTHVLFASFGVNAPTIGAGSAATTNATTVYIDNAPSGATNNYAVWGNNGAMRWDGIASIGTTPSTTTNLNLAAGTTGVSSLRIPHGSAPTSPVDGDMWTTTAGLFVRINGSTVGPLS